MADHPYIVNVTVDNFMEAVLEPSRQVPVLVDFWADWCQPCRTLTPILQKLAERYAGAFVLAKINADEQQMLAMEFGVRSLPTIKVVYRGQIVDERVGVQPESVYVQILEALGVQAPADSESPPSAAPAARAADPERALQELEAALAANPDNSDLQLERVGYLLDLDRTEEAETALEGVPADVRVSDRANALAARITVNRWARDPANPARQSAARRAISGDEDGALETFLDLVRMGDQAGREGLVTLFTLLGSQDPRVGQYRRRLSALLM